MLRFTIQLNYKDPIEVEFETKELEFLLKILDKTKKDCSDNIREEYESLENKFKAIYLLDKQPDERNVQQIKNLFFPINEISADNAHNVKISDLQFSLRTFNCLNRANIKTLAELVCLSQSELLKIRNLGIQSMNEIIDVLSKHNLELPRYKNE